MAYASLFLLFALRLPSIVASSPICILSLHNIHLCLCLLFSFFSVDSQQGFMLPLLWLFCRCFFKIWCTKWDLFVHNTHKWGRIALFWTIMIGTLLWVKRTSVNSQLKISYNITATISFHVSLHGVINHEGFASRVTITKFSLQNHLRLPSIHLVHDVLDFLQIARAQLHITIWWMLMSCCVA